MLMRHIRSSAKEIILNYEVAELRRQKNSYPRMAGVSSLTAFTEHYLPGALGEPAVGCGLFLSGFRLARNA